MKTWGRHITPPPFICAAILYLKSKERWSDLASRTALLTLSELGCGNLLASFSPASPNFGFFLITARSFICPTLTLQELTFRKRNRQCLRGDSPEFGSSNWLVCYSLTNFCQQLFWALTSLFLQNTSHPFNSVPWEESLLLFYFLTASGFWYDHTHPILKSIFLSFLHVIMEEKQKC